MKNKKRPKLLRVEHVLTIDPGVTGTGVAYWEKFKGLRLHEDHTPSKFRELIASFKYPWEPFDYVVVDKNLTIVDGNHRAAAYLMTGESMIKVLKQYDFQTYP